MTTSELKTIKQTLSPLVEHGIISQDAMSEIATLTSAKIEGKSSKLQDYVSRSEAARQLEVSEMTVIRWGQLGKLHPIKLAGRRLIRYKLSDIESLLSNTAE